jgi:hypothetical protein
LVGVRDPLPGPVTPRLRGVTHQWAFVAWSAERAVDARAAGGAIYAVSVAALF